MQLPLATDTAHGVQTQDLRPVPEAPQATGAGRGQWAQAAHLQHPAAVRVILRYSRIDPVVHQTRSWSRRTDGCKGSCLHLPSPRLRDWAPDRAFRPRQSPCVYRLPTGMVRRFPRHHPATALAGALGCRGSARGRRLWKRGCSPRPQRR